MTWFYSDRTSSSWRATSENGSLGIVAPQQIEPLSLVLQKYRKTLMGMAPEPTRQGQFHLPSQPTIEFFPYSLRESELAIFLLGILPASLSL
jgi:hypothetical protein